MADASSMRPATSSTARSGPVGEPESTGWLGWTMFAAVMMMIGGILQGTYGFIALVNDEWVVWTNRANLYVDLTTWGWVHLILGIVLALSGLGVLSGNILARTVGVVLASLSLIANFLFIPAYPMWSITAVVINAAIIWALIAHGHELRELSRDR
jgi:hypothetical protein